MNNESKNLVIGLAQHARVRRRNVKVSLGNYISETVDVVEGISSAKMHRISETVGMVEKLNFLKIESEEE